MSTSIVIRRLLICLVIFIPPCCIGDRPTFWHTYLKTSQLDEAIKTAIDKIESRYRSEDIIISNVSRLITGSPAHGQLINSMPSKNGHSASRNAEILIEASLHLIDSYGYEYGYSDTRQNGIDLSTVKLNGTIFGEMCMSEYNNRNLCTGKDLNYRSADGSCNNLERNYLGKANTAYKRLLFPEYTDGISEMPNFYEKKLPDPRLVSTNFVKNEDSPDLTKTMLMAYWAMFIGHDLSHTAVSTMGTDHRFESCCDKDKNIQYAMMKHIKSCKPIYVPAEDSLCKPDPLSCMKCMNYVRSRPAMRPDCTFGPREQMNQATHYLDASMIYGTSEQQTLSLRQMSLGLLLVDDRFFYLNTLPLETTDTNFCQNGPGTCYRAGDIRANAYPQLNALYAMWVLEHNRIAREVYKENLFLSDEEIFREAKKIVTAFIQHITYNEWLPALLGVNYTKENGLGLGQRTVYDVTADPTVSNSFATAILPFANSMIGDKISVGFYGAFEPVNVPVIVSEWNLKENYNKPSNLMKDFWNRMLTGLYVQATQKIDMVFTEMLTNYLYVMDQNYYSFGMDIVSLDIQRSRDHGIPSYTQFRKYCGLKDIENVQDLSEIMVEGSADKLLKLYKTWNDIDLLVGALLEKHVDDAMVGPTMRCLIREQFVRTRIADRYFYDVPGVFTDYQLEIIKRVTLSRVLCDIGEVEKIPLQAFLRPADHPKFVRNCDSEVPKYNLSGWFDKTRDNFFGINNSKN
ncbi:unnamed protein product [Macrosiphum euphorbiae]|uniref:Peroxidase n=1 Tax=Macrosiphum euphorbiae TaxID=13131 RepID=A0AAV0WG18_9HEMI|nr:unnamed protein product [Macrosiphum euphorbiae]